MMNFGGDMMLLKRILSAVIGAPILLFLMYKGGFFVLGAAILLAMIALWEVYGMANGLGVTAWKFTGMGTGLIFMLAASDYFGNGKHLLLAIVGWLIFCLVKFVVKYPNERLQDVSFNFLAVSYVALLFSHLVLLRSLEQGVFAIFLTLGLTWSTDTGAYFAGRALGKHKLAPKVSPNKTVEGAIGGVVLAVITVLVVAYVKPETGFSTVMLVFLAVVVSIACQFGDLAESALKRFAGVKDSGKLIPGHGGVLDRFDSILFSLPTAYYIFAYIMPN